MLTESNASTGNIQQITFEQFVNVVASKSPVFRRDTVNAPRIFYVSTRKQKVQEEQNKFTYYNRGSFKDIDSYFYEKLEIVDPRLVVLNADSLITYLKSDSTDHHKYIYSKFLASKLLKELTPNSDVAINILSSLTNADIVYAFCFHFWGLEFLSAILHSAAPGLAIMKLLPPGDRKTFYDQVYKPKIIENKIKFYPRDLFNMALIMPESERVEFFEGNLIDIFVKTYADAGRVIFFMERLSAKDKAKFSSNKATYRCMLRATLSANFLRIRAIQIQRMLSESKSPNTYFGYTYGDNFGKAADFKDQIVTTCELTYTMDENVDFTGCNLTTHDTLFLNLTKILVETFMSEYALWRQENPKVDFENCMNSKKYKDSYHFLRSLAVTIKDIIRDKKIQEFVVQLEAAVAILDLVINVNNPYKFTTLNKTPIIENAISLADYIRSIETGKVAVFESIGVVALQEILTTNSELIYVLNALYDLNDEEGYTPEQKTTYQDELKLFCEKYLGIAHLETLTRGDVNMSNFVNALPTEAMRSYFSEKIKALRELLSISRLPIHGHNGLFTRPLRVPTDAEMDQLHLKTANGDIPLDLLFSPKPPPPPLIERTDAELDELYINDIKNHSSEGWVPVRFKEMGR